MKRSKNIFNSPIVHQSLLESEGVRDFNIENRNISSNWLVGINSEEYRRYIVSALKLTDLQKQLDDMREEEGKETKQSNIFKISHTKKKIDGIQLLEVDDNQPLQKSLAKNQPPNSADFTVQKMSGGFFQSILERKCMIKQKEFYIETLKDEKNKWLPIDIKNYYLQLQDKQKPLNKQEFKQFTWINGFNQRILIWAPERKPYCLYGKEQQLKKFQRYFQVQNFEVKQLNVFKVLDNQYRQKIVTLFGNKVRFYDHFIKIRRAEKDTQLQTVKKDPHFDREDFERGKTSTQNKQYSRQSDNSGELAKSGLLQALANKQLVKLGDRTVVEPSLINLDDSKNSSKTKSRQKQRDKDKKLESQIFKLKLKTSTVFYNQILEPLDFKQKQKEEFNVGDINLNLKEEIGCSQVDEISQKQSFGESMVGSRKKITKMTVMNGIDESQKFNINIHQISSFMDKNQNQNQDLQKNLFNDFVLPTPLNRSTDSLQEFLNHQKEAQDDIFKRQNSLRISQISQMRGKSKVHRNSSDNDSVIEYFQLQKARPGDDESSFDSGKSMGGKNKTINKSDKENYLIKNFKKKRINQLQLVLTQRSESIYYVVTGIQMMMPFHSEKLHFQILQLDPELEMQRKIVACNMVEGIMNHNANKGQKYMNYSIQGGLFFKMSKESPFFVFVLQEQSKCHYINFEMDPQPKYQRNYSQFLMTKLDKEGYPFAIHLSLFASPEPIDIPAPLTTVQFLKKYLSEENYNLKHDFIQNKRKVHEIRRKWNILQSKQIVKEEDAETFSRIVFLGISDKIFQYLKRNVQFNPKKLFTFNQNQARMIEDNVLTNLYQIKSFTKPCLFVNEITKANFNHYFRQRLEQVYVYFLHRYGSIRNLALVFIKVIIDKLQPILILCRREEQIPAILSLYAEVQYEIDDLFLSISKYFKK